MVEAHLRLCSKKVGTNEMPVEAVHTLSLVKLKEKFVAPLTKVASLKHRKKNEYTFPLSNFSRQPQTA